MPRVTEIDVYIEKGYRVIASAVDWPGWCRIARSEEEALAALFAHGRRYARVARAAKLEFTAPAEPGSLRVIARFAGDMGPMPIPTDKLPADARPVKPAEVERLGAVITGCWSVFDAARRKGIGKKLALGPRGGGRDLDKIVDHVLEADAAYLSRLGWKIKLDPADDVSKKLRLIREADLDGLAASAAGRLAERGPRGGLHWKPRYFVRRAAWHILDHAWEIEDRIV